MGADWAFSCSYVDAIVFFTEHQWKSGLFWKQKELKHIKLFKTKTKTKVVNIKNKQTKKKGMKWVHAHAMQKLQFSKYNKNKSRNL